MKKMLLISALLLVLPAQVFADASPTATIKATVEKVRTTVQAKKATLDKQTLDQELKKIITPVFDFREMSRRCLGPSWENSRP